ncbi:MAG: hypothetical protein Q8M31_03570 [Beijerinckiaceae bacterium]|nr:hypothetical protein [Beijerinckiaceae bacterium]
MQLKPTDRVAGFILQTPPRPQLPFATARRQRQVARETVFSRTNVFGKPRVDSKLLKSKSALLSLVTLGVKVLTANGDDLTNADGPMKKVMRQIAGAFAELEKAHLVHKLKVARVASARPRENARDGRATARPALI